MRKCKHPHRLDRGFTVMCLDCERNGIESLGPSNDEPEAVRVEMRAAEVIAGAAVSIGSEPDAWCDDETTTFAGGPWQDEANDSRWPWDPTRPLAGQYEECLKAKQQADDEALRREAYALNAPVREFAEELAAALQSSPPDAMDDEHYDILPDSEQR